MMNTIDRVSQQTCKSSRASLTLKKTLECRGVVVRFMSAGAYFAFAHMPAAAATATTTFSVTATVQATCHIAATALAFGTYSGTQVDATSTVTATCTNSTAYNIGLSVGLGSGATITNRLMTGPSAAVLSYASYQDSARTINWGNTVSTDTVSGTGNGSAQAITVYGRVASGQYVPPGAYADTLTATITF